MLRCSPLMLKDLSSNYLLTVLDDDASSFVGCGDAADGVSLRSACGLADCVHCNTALATSELIKFLLGLSQLLTEALIALQFSIKHRSSQATSIHIALPASLLKYSITP